MKKSLRKVLISLGLLAATTTSAFAVYVNGGQWTYGCNNDIGNWGAYSSYHHASKYHWASVVSAERPNRSSRVSASAGKTAYAFINTNIGEVVYFDYGF